MIKMLNIIKRKGLTLIEIVVSLALIGIIAVSFLTMFTMGFKQIATSGNKSKSIYVSQDEAENKLLSGAATNTATMEVTFPSAPTAKVNGEDVSKGSIRFFIPR